MVCTGEYYHPEVCKRAFFTHVGPVTNLMGSKVACMGLGNTYTRPLGYIVIQVQVDGVQGYDED